ncbi:MAG: enoyl-CoA hydratase/isomerase family protein [Pseudomonadota bacterium]
MLETTDHAVSADAAPGEAFIREIRLARPPVNALNAELLRGIQAALLAAKNAAAVIITGQTGLFSAGLDVRGMLTLDRDGVTATFVELWRTGRALAMSPMPVIMGITGHSPAGGTVLAVHGDYRVMAQGNFRLGLNEVQVGLFPGALILGAFRRLAGGHAAQFLTRGALMDPDTALRIGLVDELCDPGEVVARSLTMAREFCALPREIMLRTRELTRRDLIDLYGKPGQYLLQEREFGAMAAEKWFVPATQERLQQAFTKKS